MPRACAGRSLALPLVLALAIAGCALPGPSAPGGVAVQPAASVPQAAPQVLAAGVVKGRVMAFDGVKGTFSPLAGAAVRVEGQPFTTVTDARGGYSMEGLPPGEYRIRAEKDGRLGQVAEVKVNGVMGLERVDLAIAASRPYALKLLDKIDQLDVYGVIRDPRGCAVPQSTMYVTATSGVINPLTGDEDEVTVTDAKTGTAIPVEQGRTAKVVTSSGLYSFRVTNADDYVRFTASIFAETPGGIALERTGAAFTVDTNDTAVDAKDADGQTINVVNPQQFDVQFNKFTGAQTPVGYPPYELGDTTAELRVPRGLSSRPDEFFVRLVQGKEQYDVVPISVRASSNDEDDPVDTVVFRIPETMSTVQNFTASIVQLGLQASAPSLPLTIGTLTLEDFKSLVQFSRGGILVQPSLRQVPDAFTVQNKYFTDAERVQFRLTLRNPRTFDFAVDLKFKLPGVSNPTARFGSKAFAATYDKDTEIVSVPFVIPARTSGQDITVEFTVANLDNDESVKAEDIALTMARKTPLTIEDYQDTNALTVRTFKADGWLIAKALSDDNSPANGRGLVQLSLKPPLNYVGPQGAFRVWDVTDTNGTDPAEPQIVGTNTVTADLSTGSLVLPTTPDEERTAVFGLGVPGGLDVQRAVVFGSGIQNLASLQAAIDTQLGPDTVKLTQDLGNNRLEFELVNGGDKIGLISAGSALRLLGLDGPITADIRTGGITPTLVGATTNLPGWTVRPVSADVPLDAADLGGAAAGLTLRRGAQTGLQASNGRMAVAFEVVPSADAQPFTNQAPLIVTYKVVADSAASINIGDATGFGRARLSDHAYLGAGATFKDTGLAFFNLSTVAGVTGI
jgi:hypothetical protein